MSKFNECERLHGDVDGFFAALAEASTRQRWLESCPLGELVAVVELPVTATQVEVLA